MAPNVVELNKALAAVLDGMVSDNVAAAAHVRFSIIGFHDFATTHLPLADFRFIEAMPTLGAYQSTSYADGFRALKRQIESDMTSLKADGWTTLRSAVFFLTDGAPNPNEDWRTPYNDLVGESFHYHPNVVAFGIGSADAATIREVATKSNFAFIAAQGMDTGAALISLFEELTKSIVGSAASVAAGMPQLPVSTPSGFIQLDVT